MRPSMTDDIVNRLRERAIVLFCNGADGNAFIDEQAADEIERLRHMAERMAMAIDAHHGMFAPIEEHIMCDEIYKQWKSYQKESNHGDR